jgi:hypothetical protein
MKAAGLVTAKTSLVFYNWNIDTGPIVESSLEMWNEIASFLAKGRVDLAASSLRRHMEFVSRQIADGLGARTVFKADAIYNLGELLPPTLGRLKELLGKAVDAAQSWGNDEMKATALERKKLLSAANRAKCDEEWVVNKAVHYNEWAKFGKADFEPVVTAFSEVLKAMQCSDCNSWLYISPRGSRPDALRCRCGSINLNLNLKPKQ